MPPCQILDVTGKWGHPPASEEGWEFAGVIHMPAVTNRISHSILEKHIFLHERQEDHATFSNLHKDTILIRLSKHNLQILDALRILGGVTFSIPSKRLLDDSRLAFLDLKNATFNGILDDQVPNIDSLRLTQPMDSVDRWDER